MDNHTTPMTKSKKKTKYLRTNPTKLTKQKKESIPSLHCRLTSDLFCPIVFPSPPTEPMFSRGQHNNCSFDCPPAVGRALQKKVIAPLRSRLIASSSDLLEINWIVFRLSNLSRLQISRVHPGSQAESLVKYFLFFCC